MKNWLKNLLFVLFSFVFLGVGMLIANILIQQKGNPLKDPNFLAETAVDSMSTIASLPIDSTDGWLGDTIQVPELIVEIPKSEVNKQQLLAQHEENLGEYDVVIGMFEERSNANKQIRKLKEFGFDNAYSYSKSSMNVVSAGKFEKLEAQKIASNLNNKGFEAIVKHR